MNFVFAFVAGLLTTLSPCVLPVLPFVTASSLGRSRFGPLALALGLLVSFLGVSFLISTSGLILGLDPAIVRRISGVLLSLSGILFLSQTISDGIASRLSFFSKLAGNAGTENRKGVIPELLNGMILGVVWTPCSGPSLGAALSLAAQAGSAGKAAITLGIFGVGAVIPLLAFAYGTRRFIGTVRSHSIAIVWVKKFFGILIVLTGLMIVLELDRNLEAYLNGLLPDWWLSMITKF